MFVDEAAFHFLLPWIAPPFSVQIPNVKQIPQHSQGTLSQNILLMLQLHPCNPPPWLQATGYKVPNQSMQNVTKHILTLHGFGQVDSWSEFGLNISHRVTVPLLIHLILYSCQTRKKVHMGRAYLLETHINTHTNTYKHVKTENTWPWAKSFTGNAVNSNMKRIMWVFYSIYTHKQAHTGAPLTHPAHMSGSHRELCPSSPLLSLSLMTHSIYVPLDVNPGKPWLLKGKCCW